MSLAAHNTLRAVCNTNRGILNQKIRLIDALVERFGHDQAKNIYKQPCRIVKATIGQHIRHSNDHIDRALAAARLDASSKVIHYDLRQRGGADESDMDAAMDRILGVESSLQDLLNSADGDTCSPAFEPVEACFMLSGDEETEHFLPSTVARELAFAAHHAIHHLALVRIIAESEAIKLDLPAGFGTAPSTTNFQRKL